MARPDNPFDLSSKAGRAGPGRPYHPTVYTAEEQAERLENYITIPKEHWALVHYGRHVRYITRAGAFRIGGFVARNPFDTASKGSTVKKRYIKLQNGFNPRANNYAEWLVAYEDLAALYVKPDAVSMTVQKNVEDALRTLNANVSQLAAFVKKLQQRLRALEGP